jgi:hypothetical protein
MITLLLAGPARAQDLFDLFISACGSQTDNIEAISQKSTGNGWSSVSPTKLSIVQQGFTVSPKALAMTHIVDGVMAELLADKIMINLRPPYPPTIVKRSCLISAPGIYPALKAKVEAWLGPDVSVKAERSPSGTIYEAILAGSKFAAVADSLPYSDPRRLKAINIVVITSSQPAIRTTIMEFSPYE